MSITFDNEEDKKTNGKNEEHEKSFDKDFTYTDVNG